MATATGSYHCDNSSFANFADWATSIGQAFLAFGWKQSNDTGQVMWLGCSISACAMSGSNATYTYSGLTTSGNAAAFQVGQAVTITGFTGGNTGCNGTFVITALGTGTFTVVNATGTNNSGASGLITKQATVTTVTEIWVSQDTQSGTLPVYLKMQYGSSGTQVIITISAGTGSNGTGTLSNMSFNAVQLANNANQGTTLFPCYFSGDAGEFRMLMFQNLSLPTAFGVERSKDGSGNKTADYFTALGLWNTTLSQQTTVSTSSVAPQGIPVAAAACNATAATGFFSGTVAAFPLFPVLGKIGNPMMNFMGVFAADVNDNAMVSVTSFYGGTHTCIASKGGGSSAFGNIAASRINPATCAVLMRYE